MSTEKIEPARAIAADPSLLAFIPDDRFKGTLRATVAGSLRGTTATTSLLTIVSDGDVITIWTWSADKPVTGQKIGHAARAHASYPNRTRRVKRFAHTVFTSPDNVAGVASLTTYFIIKGEYER